VRDGGIVAPVEKYDVVREDELLDAYETVGAVVAIRCGVKVPDRGDLIDG
jgi:hypothetical protein